MNSDGHPMRRIPAGRMDPASRFLTAWLVSQCYGATFTNRMSP